jgi:hypothetical protein
MEKKTGFISAMFAVLLALTTLHAGAAQQIGRDFNHMTTGFGLSGGHAAAACESCHVGGVFKGTPRTCDGCHAVGKRVVATPKNDKHIVTDAPCDSCHFNTATWLGARFNHGSAVTGQCRNCHNGRQAQGKPANHSVGRKATESCDQCHRTFAWLPSSWNHNNSAGSCDQAGCHLAGQNSWYKGVTTAHTRTGMATYACQSCHNYLRWSPAPFNHSIGGRCDSCHNEVIAVGPNHYGTHTAAISGNDCSQCHINTTHAWKPALGALPPNHIPFNAGTACTACHLSVTSVRTGAAMHIYTSSLACTTCHLKNNQYAVWGQDTKSIGHEGMRSGDDCSKSGCHAPLGRKGIAYIKWD